MTLAPGLSLSGTAVMACEMREQWQIQEIFEGGLGGRAKAGFTAEVPRTIVY